MEAAAHGGSTLGIPKKVGKEFVAKDATAGHAAGVLYVAPDGDVLLLRRSGDEKNYGGHWALPGGKADGKETPEQAADRETVEELGEVPAGNRRVLDRRVTPNNMAFHTFAQPVSEKFAPKLNDEHVGYAWAPLSQLPGPIHPGVAKTLNERLGVGEDMSESDWSGLTKGFLKWLSEEEGEEEHAEDDTLLTPPNSAVPTLKRHAQDSYAFDRASVRRTSSDGRLHVEISNISKATVNPYKGSEIPGYEMLGLKADKVYNLFRDPEELKKAAKTFNNIPVLIKHVPVTVYDHQPELVVGATGTDAEFSMPYLRNSLVIWEANAIEGVENDDKRELSCAYRYDPDMTPGTFEGVAYDGVMRNIEGNHVALVPAGRAGPDVVVGDSQLEIGTMSTKAVFSPKAAVCMGALLVHLPPLLAKDAQIDLSPAFKGITAKNYHAKLPVLKEWFKQSLQGKLAQDAKLTDIHGLLDRLDDGKEGDKPKEDGDLGSDVIVKAAEENAETTKDASPWEQAKAHLTGKISEDDMAEVDKIMGPKAEDSEENEEEEEGVEGEPGAKPAADKKKLARDKVTGAIVEGAKGGGANPAPARDKWPSKGAMDAALVEHGKKVEQATIARLTAIADARTVVKPHVGELTIALDSAEAVYRYCLETKGVEVPKQSSLASLKVMVGLLPLPNARVAPRIAQDSSGAASFKEMFPMADKAGRAA